MSTLSLSSLPVLVLSDIKNQKNVMVYIIHQPKNKNLFHQIYFITQWITNFSIKKHPFQSKQHSLSISLNQINQNLHIYSPGKKKLNPKSTVIVLKESQHHYSSVTSPPKSHQQAQTPLYLSTSLIPSSSFLFQQQSLSHYLIPLSPIVAVKNQNTSINFENHSSIEE